MEYVYLTNERLPHCLKFEPRYSADNVDIDILIDLYIGDLSTSDLVEWLEAHHGRNNIGWDVTGRLRLDDNDRYFEDAAMWFDTLTAAMQFKLYCSGWTPSWANISA